MEDEITPATRLLDLGCGSGILFIGGMLLGAKEAYAVDIEENATRIAKENAAENHLNPENYTISCGNIITDTALRIDRSGCDVITANIVADVIKAWLRCFRRS
ncbi:MAG: 50S ribosomal protein L11 methyltransferase [Ruminococcus callidus]